MLTDEGRALRVAMLARVVYPLHGYGGLQQHVYDLVRSLLARDVHVTLITQPPAPDRPRDARADATLGDERLTLWIVPYRTFPFANRRGTTILDRSTAYPVFGWRAGRVAARLARRGEVDVVHGHGASALGYAVARGTPSGRAPLVFNPHGMEEFGSTSPSRARLKRLAYWPLRLAVRRCAHAADRVIATDRSLVGTVTSHLRVPQAAVSVIPNAIEMSDYAPPVAAEKAVALRREIGLGPDELLLLSVGRIEANKGFDIFAGALAALAADGTLPGSSWRWVLVGDGPMRATLSRRLEEHGLTRQVVLPGRVSREDLHAWYEAATLFVHPTLYEGSSLVTLEAMAHGLGIVATNAGGLPDKVRPGVNGWLVPPGDSTALADAVRDALADRSRLAVLGAASRAIVEREFSWDAAVDQTLQVYRDLLGARTSVPAIETPADPHREHTEGRPDRP